MGFILFKKCIKRREVFKKKKNQLKVSRFQKIKIGFERESIFQKKILSGSETIFFKKCIKRVADIFKKFIK